MRKEDTRNFTHAQKSKWAMPDSYLKRLKKAVVAMERAGLNTQYHPILRYFLSYCAMKPGTFKEGEWDTEDGNRALERLGYQWRRIEDLLGQYKAFDCTDEDLLRSMKLAAGGRFSYLTIALVWDAWIQYRPIESWGHEYRIAGREVLEHCIREKKWLDPLYMEKEVATDRRAAKHYYR